MSHPPVICAGPGKQHTTKQKKIEVQQQKKVFMQEAALLCLLFKLSSLQPQGS